MTANRRDVNREETRKHIKKTFMGLYKEKGIDGVTVNELCRRAGIVKSTFYTYFEDKYSVLEEIEKELLDQLAEINTNLEEIDVNKVLKGEPFRQAYETVDFITAHINDYRIIMGPKGDPRFEHLWRRNIAVKFNDRFFKEKGNEKNAGLACEIFVSALMGVYRYFIFKDQNISRENFALLIGNTFVYALNDFYAAFK